MQFALPERFSQVFFPFVLIFCFFYQNKVHAEADSTEKLKRALLVTQKPAERTALLITLSQDLISSDPIAAKLYITEAISICQHTDSSQQYARALAVMGKIFTHTGKLDSALFFLNQASNIPIVREDDYLRFEIHNQIGTVLTNQQAYDSAEFHYQLCSEIAGRLNKPDYLAAINNNLGMLADERGMLQQAFDYYLIALKYYDDISDLANQAVVLNNLGLVNQALGDNVKAIEFLKKAIEINTGLNNQLNVSMNYGNLGTCYKILGNNTEALACFQHSLTLSRELGLELDQAKTLMNMGNLYVQMNKFEEAESHFKASLEICERNNIVYGILINYYNIAGLYYYKKDYSQAIEYLEKSNQLAQEQGNIKMYIDIYKLYEKINEALGNYKLAFFYHKNWDIITDSLKAMANKEYILDLQAKYQVEKKELENKNLRTENTAKALSIRNQKITTAAVAFVLFLTGLLAIVLFRSRDKAQRANQQLNELNNKILIQNTALEEVNTTKDKLFSIIAHDLKSPFNSLLSFLQLLIDEKADIDENKKKEILMMLYQHSNNTYSLIENLLQWALGQRGHLQFNPGNFDLRQIVEAEIEFLSGRADKKNIRIINTIEVNSMAWVDENMVKIIFRNLLNNAIKFSFENSVITINSIRCFDKHEVTITDHGIGMPEKVSKALFSGNNFYSTKGTKNESGSGLGLMIVKELMDKQGCSFRVNSTEGKGTVITLGFPLADNGPA